MNEQKTDPQKLAIMAGWLVYEVGQHTCGGYGPESGYMHEPGCGFEPLMTVEDLDVVLREHAERDAERRAAGSAADAAGQGGGFAEFTLPSGARLSSGDGGDQT